MKYQVILADPPWKYQNFLKAAHGASCSAYEVMTDRDIVNLPIGNIAADDALLFLWATWPKLEIAFDCFRSWGFKYVTSPNVWVKEGKDGGPYTGIGFWTQVDSEFVLLGRRGKGVPRKGRGGVRQVHRARPTRKHSEKPPGLHEKIEAMIGPGHSSIELFARSAPPDGWDATGLEFDGVDIRDFLVR